MLRPFAALVLFTIAAYLARRWIYRMLPDSAVRRFLFRDYTRERATPSDKAIAIGIIVGFYVFLFVAAAYYR